MSTAANEEYGIRSAYHNAQADLDHLNEVWTRYRAEGRDTTEVEQIIRDHERALRRAERKARKKHIDLGPRGPRVLSPAPSRDRRVVFAGQAEEIPPRRPLPYGAKPEPSLRTRFLWLRPWKFALRVQPAPDEDLYEFGRRAAAAAGMPLQNAPEPGDEAVWLCGGIWAWGSRDALSAALRFMPTTLGELEVVASQISVERWR